MAAANLGGPSAPDPAPTPPYTGSAMSKPPRFAPVVAVFLGLVAAFAPANLPLESPSFAVALAISAVIFGIMGFVLGVVWRGVGWRWGLWVIAPGLALVTLGVISSRDFASFFTDDIPFLAVGFVTASLGATLGTRLRGPKP